MLQKKAGTVSYGPESGLVEGKEEEEEEEVEEKGVAPSSNLSAEGNKEQLSLACHLYLC